MELVPGHLTREGKNLISQHHTRCFTLFKKNVASKNASLGGKKKKDKEKEREIAITALTAFKMLLYEASFKMTSLSLAGCPPNLLPPMERGQTDDETTNKVKTLLPQSVSLHITWSKRTQLGKVLNCV